MKELPTSFINTWGEGKANNTAADGHMTSGRRANLPEWPRHLVERETNGRTSSSNYEMEEDRESDVSVADG